MGLDIVAYRKLTKLDALFNADGEPVDPVSREVLTDDYFQVYANCDFPPDRYAGLEDKAVYDFAGSYHFRAGSYGGYNEWRETLATMAGYPTLEVERVPGYAPSKAVRRDAAAWAGMCEGMPFSELVNFSDCEGVLSAPVCRKLAKDFADWDQRAKVYSACSHIDEAKDSWFYAYYKEWHKAFDMAGDSGAVSFG